MGEIITVHVGSAGCRLGAAFWRSIAAAHGIGPEGMPSAGAPRDDGDAEILFSVTPAQRYQPRALFVGDAELIEELRRRDLGHMFQPASYLPYGSGAWLSDGRGPASDDPKLLQGAMDRLRRLTDGCRSAEGFLFTHAIGGRTASRLAPRLMEQVAKAYPEMTLVSLMVLPASDLVDGSPMTAPYSAVASAAAVADCAHLVILLDNLAAYEACNGAPGVEHPSCEHMNEVLARAIGAFTAPLRRPREGRVTLAARVAELAPEPGQNFAFLAQGVPGGAPLAADLGGLTRVLGHFDCTRANRAYVHWMERDGLDLATLDRARARLGALRG